MKKLAVLITGILLSSSVFSADLSSDEFANLVKKAENGNAIAQNLLANEYEKQHNESKWLEWLTKSANNGYVLSQFKLGNLYEEGYKLPQSNDKAIEWYTKSAKQGYMLSYRSLGSLYYKRNDYIKFVEMLKEAGNLGDAFSQYTVGFYYFTGRGVNRDVSIAQQWFYKACLNGSMDGCRYYQRIYLLNH